MLNNRTNISSRHFQQCRNVVYVKGEDTKGVISCHKSNMERQDNGKGKKENITNNDIQDTIQTTKGLPQSCSHQPHKAALGSC